MIPATTREVQATACLEAAQQHRERLLSLAAKLCGGSEERGMDLYQQTLLNCHDAIQRNGFAGTNYEFYLYTSLRNLHRKEGQRAAREVPHDFQRAEASSGSRNDEGNAPWAAQVRRQQCEAAGFAGGLAPETDALVDLAEQVQAQLRAGFQMPDRIALRLHVEGLSYREIAEAMGHTNQNWVWRRVERLKTRLRHTLGRAWQALQVAE